MIHSLIILPSYYWTSFALIGLHLVALIGIAIIVYKIGRKINVMSSTEYQIWQAMNDMRQTYRQAGLPIDENFGDGLD